MAGSELCQRNDAISAFKIAFGNFRDKVRNMNIDRAAADAGLVLAVEAALGFFDCRFRRIA